MFEFTSHFCVCFVLLFFVVQFSMTIRLPARSPSRRLDYYITLSRLCQYLFQNFFKFFSLFPSAPLSGDSFSILSLYSSLVKGFLKVFSICLFSHINHCILWQNATLYIFISVFLQFFTPKGSSYNGSKLRIFGDYEVNVKNLT